MKNLKIILIMMGLLTAATVTAQSDMPQSWFEEGNAAYNEGNYDLALEKYGHIVDFGEESASLYYNMGNTYYKLREYPLSILYYEKALKLDPRNADIKTNLEIANLAVADRIEKLPEPFYTRWWNSLKSLFSIDGWAWVSIVAFALTLLCLYLFLMARRTGLRKAGFFVGLLMVVALALSITFAVEKNAGLSREDQAIITTPTVTVKSSPSTSGIDLFVLHEGSKVKILDRSMEWNKIRIADGSEGWLQAEEMIAF